MNKKQTIRLNESQINNLVTRVVKESINKIVEDTKSQRRKDPMNQWFKDMEQAQQFRDTMDYIVKGGRKPKQTKIAKEAADKTLQEWVDYEDNPYDETNLWNLILEMSNVGEHVIKAKEEKNWVNHEALCRRLYSICNTVMKTIKEYYPND